MRIMTHVTVFLASLSAVFCPKCGSDDPFMGHMPVTAAVGELEGK